MSVRELHDEIHAAVVHKIASLDLPEIGEHCYEQMLADERNVILPCALVTIDGLSEKVEPFSTSSNLCEYPVQVLLADRNEKNYVRPMRLYKHWRAEVLNAFANRRFSEVSGVHLCNADPGQIVDWKLPQYMYVVSGIVLRFEAIVDRE